MTKKGYIFILIFIGFLVFFNSLTNGFVWDDEEQVLNNVLVHSISNFSQFFSGSTFNTGGSGVLGGLYYKPLMTTFFSIIYTIFGANPFFFHLFQLSIHIINSIFVFLIFRHFFHHPKSDLISFVLALIFLVHPINVETVVYISCYQDILFFFFGIVAFWLVVSKQLASFKKYLLLFLLLLFSLFSKESGILFIILIAFYILLFLKKYLKTYLIISFFSVATYSFFRFLIAGIFLNKHGLTPISTLPFFERLISVPKVFYFYIETFFYPLNLAISQHWVVRSATIFDFYIPLFLCLLVLILLVIPAIIFHLRKNLLFKSYLFFLVWFLLGLSLHLHIIFPLDMTVSERWFYFPMIGLLGILGIIFSKIRFNRITKNIFAIFLVIIILILGIRTIIRNANWKDSLTLYGHDILISKDTFDLENNYGVALFRVGRYDEAGLHFAKSTQLAPNWWTNWNNLGAIEERNNNIENAKIDYKRAIDNGQYYLAYQNLAKIYLIHGSAQQAKLFCEESLKTLPNNASLWSTLAIAQYRLKEMDKAIISAKNAYYLEPSELNAYIYSRLIKNLPLEN